jgi:argininosuccinate lyase
MKLWGGRFGKAADETIEAFTASLPFDRRMALHDVRGSIAHVRMLGRCKIIPAADAARIEQGLREISGELESGVLEPQGAEDIHSFVEQQLTARMGPVAGRLHTARSRNDQVATDERLYLKEVVTELQARVRTLQRVLVRHAEAHTRTVLPGMTHMQHAQPIVLAHHLLAYFWMLERDRSRLDDGARRADVLPLGAGALAGTPFPIDREMVARELGFARVSENSLDSVADRDFVLEMAAALSILMVHLSRLAEEVVLWNTREFGFIALDDSVATGSSIMPQKKNPDVAELVRGKTGRVCGNLSGLLMVMKGLPLAYNSDMQEDKEQLFDSIDTVCGCLAAMTRLLETTTFRPERMHAATHGDFSTATDLADYLVRQGMPFREAHGVVGRIVRWCEENGKTLEELDAAALRGFSEQFAPGAEALVTVVGSAEARRSHGGTSPEQVERQLAQAKNRLEASNGQETVDGRQ